MSKDVVLDRYARLYEIPFQLARLGHDVRGYCLDYHRQSAGEWTHDAAPGTLFWESRSLGSLCVPELLSYPLHLLRRLRRFAPDIVIGASDIPHVALTRWLARRLKVPYAIDLYDNFEGFGQARIPGFVAALRWGVRQAALVTTTSEPLREYVAANYDPAGKIWPMPSSVDLRVFRRRDRQACRATLGLPADVKLIGTAGSLFREKGVLPLYDAWSHIRSLRPDVHLVLAGPYDEGCPPPRCERIHYLGLLDHQRVAMLFSALDVGVISVLDTPFGRYCFPQKAYEMLACGLPVVAADIGAMASLFADYPQVLFPPGNSTAMATAILAQLDGAIAPNLPIADWSELIGDMAERLPTSRRA